MIPSWLAEGLLCLVIIGVLLYAAWEGKKSKQYRQALEDQLLREEEQWAQMGTQEGLDRALDYAMGRLDLQRCRELLEQGADPNARGYLGWRPLQNAVDNEADSYAQIGWSDVLGEPPSGSFVKLLLEFGADPNLTDDRGKTPLDIATDYHAAAEEILKQAGGKRGSELR